VFILAFLSIIALIAYIHFAPWKSWRQETGLADASQNSFITATITAALASTTATTTTTTTVYSEYMEYMANETSLPLINFKDLGSHVRKVLLLIIVSSAPQRFDRRQAIRDTWWKHCNGSQVNNLVDSRYLRLKWSQTPFTALMLCQKSPFSVWPFSMILLLKSIRLANALN